MQVHAISIYNTTNEKMLICFINFVLLNLKCASISAATMYEKFNGWLVDFPENEVWLNSLKFRLHKMFRNQHGTTVAIFTQPLNLRYMENMENFYKISISFHIYL